MKRNVKPKPYDQVQKTRGEKGVKTGMRKEREKSQVEKMVIKKKNCFSSDENSHGNHGKWLNAIERIPT